MNESKGMTKELIKLRIGAHKLKIESCRYARPKIPRQNRLCICCNKIEDESHFLLHCMNNQSLRVIIYKHQNFPIEAGNDMSQNCLKLCVFFSYVK